MHTTRMTVAAACFAVAALAAKDANAFCRATTNADSIGADGCPTAGAPLYWKSQCVGVHMSEAASEYVTLAQAQALMATAFHSWVSAAGVCAPSINVIPLAPTPNAKADYVRGGNNENDFVFIDRNWPYTSPGQELVTTHYDKTGELNDADIELNGAAIASILGTDGGLDPVHSNWLRHLFVHAAGHFLGFGHSLDVNSVMYPIFDPGDDTAPELTADDAQGMCEAYPSDGTRPTRDALGNDIALESTQCMLSTAVAATGTGGCNGTGPVHLDHGCSVGARGGTRGDALAVCLGVLALALVGARRRGLHTQ